MSAPKYPLTEITNFSLAQPTLQLPNFAPGNGSDELPLGQTREIYDDAPPRRGRGKNRRGRQRGGRPREVGGTISGGAVLRSPIPLVASSLRSSLHPAFDFRVARRKSTPASPILSHASSHKSSYNTTNAHSRTPPRRFPSVSVVSSEMPRYACKRAKRWASNSPRGRLVSPPSPPTPTPINRWPSRPNKPPPDAPNTIRRLPSSIPLRFPAPPTSALVSPCSSLHSNHGKQFSFLASMNLGPGIPQGQMRKKQTKRDLAEVQWQITMHKSLAWRTTREHLKAEKQNGCQSCAMAEDLSHEAMNFALRGLKIAFERPACACASGNEPQTGDRDLQLHWTDFLDQELVKRLWVKLIAQGCRTIPSSTSSPQPVSKPFPTVEHSQCGIPFPSEQPEQPLAPAIQLSSISRPVSGPQMGSAVPMRQRVSAITSSKTRPHMSLPNTHVSYPTPCAPAAVSMLQSSSLIARRTYPDSQVQMPRISARIPKGRLSSAQLTAQAILRHEDASLKPMKRGRPPGIMQRSSSLRHEITAD